jgi:hypothetical protein
VGQRPRAEHRLGRAAGLGPVGVRVGPQLDRDRGDLRPALAFATPPDTATSTRVSSGCASGNPLEAIAETALANASAASTAAWRAAKASPPSSRSTPSVETFAASRMLAPSTISATQAQAARVAAQPSASKVTASTRPSAGSREIRARSPQAKPPAAPATGIVGQVLLEQQTHPHRVKR